MQTGQQQQTWSHTKTDTKTEPSRASVTTHVPLNLEKFHRPLDPPRQSETQQTSRCMGIWTTTHKQTQFTAPQTPGPLSPVTATDPKANKCQPSPKPQGPTMAPTWHLNMVPIHVSRGVPEQAVGDEAVGVHAVDEWKGSLGVGRGEEQGQAEPWPCSSPSPLTTSTTPAQPQALTMPVSDVKMTISYKGASCWNKVSMPGRFLNLQPVASWKCSENSDAPRPEYSLLSLWLVEGFTGTGLRLRVKESAGSGPAITAASPPALTVCQGTAAITYGWEAAQVRNARQGG